MESSRQTFYNRPVGATNKKKRKRPSAAEGRGINAADRSIRPPLRSVAFTAAVMLFFFAVGAALRFEHLNDVASRTPDERVYSYYALQVAGKGLGAFPALVQQYNLNQSAWIYPPPVRAGYLAALAGAMKISGAADERAGAWLACAASLASLAVIGVIGVRFLPVWAAIYAMLSLAVSVPDLVIARRCWQDGCLGLFGLLLVFCTCEIVRRGASWRTYAGLAAAGILAALTKESGAAIYAGCALFLVLHLSRRRAWRATSWLLVGVLAAGGLCLCCYALAAGGFPALESVLNHEKAGFVQNAYTKEYLSGPPYNLIRGFWIFNPVNCALMVLGVVLSCLPEGRLKSTFRLGPEEVSLLRLFSLATLLPILMVLIAPAGQNFRYLTPAFGPMYLLGGLGLWGAFHLLRRDPKGFGYQAAVGGTAVLVLWSSIVGYRSFERVYVDRGVPDLAIKLVLDSAAAGNARR